MQASSYLPTVPYTHIYAVQEGNGYWLGISVWQYQENDDDTVLNSNIILLLYIIILSSILHILVSH